MLSVLSYGRVLAVPTAVTWFGLALDVIGAITLARGLLWTDMARLAQAMDNNISVERTRCRWLPLWVARRWGSREATDTVSYTAEEYAETFYGVVLLMLGFVFQGIGAWLASR